MSKKRTLPDNLRAWNVFVDEVQKTLPAGTNRKVAMQVASDLKKQGKMAGFTKLKIMNKNNTGTPLKIANKKKDVKANILIDVENGTKPKPKRKRKKATKKGEGLVPEKGFVIPNYKWAGPMNPYDKQVLNDDECENVIPRSGQEPINAVDAIAMWHDCRFSKASKIGDPDAKARYIRQSDEEFVRRVKNVKPKDFTESYGKFIAQKGIQSKMNLENLLPKSVGRKILYYSGKGVNKPKTRKSANPVYRTPIQPDLAKLIATNILHNRFV